MQTLFKSVGRKAARVPHRSVLAVSGSQASSFLNGLVSSSIPEKGHCYSAFLNAQGRILYDVFIYRGDHQYLVEYDLRPSEAQPLLNLLKRFVLRSKVKIRDASDEYDVWAAWGSEHDRSWETTRHWSWARSGACEPQWSPEDEWPWGNEDRVIRDRRAVGMGHRLLVKKDTIPNQTHDIATEDDYKMHRLMHGVPEGHIDIPGAQAFPMDSNLDVMGALDFRKGCYVGQELTVRTYHTGAIRKRILPVLIYESGKEYSLEEMNTHSFPSGLEIRAIANEGRQISRPRGTGKLLTSMRGLALALLRLDHIEGCNNGDLSFQFQDESGKPWSLTHSWPDWWPQRPNHIE